MLTWNKSAQLICLIRVLSPKPVLSPCYFLIQPQQITCHSILPVKKMLPWTDKIYSHFPVPNIFAMKTKDFRPRIRLFCYVITKSYPPSRLQDLESQKEEFSGKTHPMMKFIPNHGHAWLTELKNFLELSRNETLLFSGQDFSILSAKNFNSKSGNIWDRKLHLCIDGRIWLPDSEALSIFLQAN